MTTAPICPVCHSPVHLAGETIHPCCSHAAARGDDGCGGCRGYRERRKAGNA